MRCRVLGAVELIGGDGRPRAIGSRSQRLILAVLAAHRGRVVPADALIDTLWPDDPPASAVTTLRTYISRLRHDLSDVLESKSSGYSLALSDDQIDAGQFESLLAAAATTADPAAAAQLLRSALDHCAGPAFGSEADARLVRGEAARLDELALAARIRLASLELEMGRVDIAVGLAESLVAEVPHLEPSWDVLVRALTAAGRTADALRAFQRAADELAELGLEPSAALRDAERRALAPAVPDRPRVATSRRGHVPHPSTVLVGRQRDLDALVALIGRARLITVVGSGGVGKTRLVAEFARRAGQAVWVELAPVTSDDDVASAVLTALGVAAAGVSSLDVLGELVDLDAVVVLDNAEHVLNGVAATVTTMLASSPRVRIMVTSRERLGVEGEHRWHVAPLRASAAFDGGPSDAAELFVARAQMSDPSTQLASDDPRVTTAVERLDGLPLAIEMAAAQLASMTIAELSDELSRGFSMLVAPRRTVARQRDLSSLIEWSERLLDADELTTLHEFSVFAGAVAVSDAVGVLGGEEVPRVLRGLADRSLVETEQDNSAMSFRMLVTVRDHAAGRLRSSGRSGPVQRRHAEWFTEQAEAADRAMRDGDHGQARARFEAVAAELRAAHRCARIDEPQLAARLSTALHTQARYTMFDEPFAWAELLVERGGDPVLAGAGAWASASSRSIARGDLAEALERSRRSLEVASDARQRMLGLDLAGDAALFDGRLAEAAALYDELFDLAVAEGDRLYTATAGTGRAMTLTYGGAADDAIVELDRLTSMPDPGPVASGWLAYAYGEALSGIEADRAMRHYDRAIALAQQSGCRFLEGVSRVSAGSLQARVGEVDPALHSFASLVKIWLDLGERTHQRTTLRNLVVLLHRANRPRDAAALLGSIDRGAVATYGDEARRLDDARQWAAARLGNERYAASYAEGAARDIAAAGRWAVEMLRSEDR